MASLSQQRPLIVDQHQPAAASIQQPEEHLENVLPNNQQRLVFIQQLPVPVNKPQSEPYVSGN